MEVNTSKSLYVCKIKYATKNEYKPIVGTISPGCLSCIKGDWFCFYLTPLCNKNCFFCMNSFEKNPNGFPKTSENIILKTNEDYIKYIKEFKFKGISFSGGEPLLVFDKLISLLQDTRDTFGNYHYIWLYTNGALITSEKLKKLQELGLNEIRFDIAANNYSLDAVKLALEYINTVTIEIPVIPEDVEVVKGKLPTMESIGVKHLNLHQLAVTKGNYENLCKRNYESLARANDINLFPIIESESAAIELLHYGSKVLKKMGINYCSQKYKDVYQRIAYRKRWSLVCKEKNEYITDLGFIRSFILEDSSCQLEYWQFYLNNQCHVLEKNKKIQLSLSIDCIPNFFDLNNLPKLIIKYYKPKLIKENADCDYIGNANRIFNNKTYIFKKELLFKYKFNSILSLFFFYKLFIENLTTTQVINSICSSAKIPSARMQEIQNSVLVTKNIFEKFEQLI